MGNRTRPERAKDAPEPLAGDQVGEPQKRNAAGSAARDVHAIDRALCDADDDGECGTDARAGPRSTVFSGLPASAAHAAARVPVPGSGAGRLAPGIAGGDGHGANRAPTQPDQPARRPGQDVQVREETPRASRDWITRAGVWKNDHPAARCATGHGITTYASFNGIAFSRDAKRSALRVASRLSHVR